MNDIQHAEFTRRGKRSMKEPGLEDRYRKLLGRISRKRGGISLQTLRQHHGGDFLPQLGAETKLSDVLPSLDMASLHQLELQYPDDGFD